jgi:hypothetical protein
VSTEPEGRAVPPSEATVIEPCDTCRADWRCELSQAVVDDRLQWTVWCRCESCGSTVQECGWDDPPAEIRAAIVEQCGLARLRVPDAAGAQRLRVMKVLRDNGVPMADVAATVERLGGAGLAGTVDEMELLAGRLRRVGVHPVTERIPPGTTPPPQWRKADPT